MEEHDTATNHLEAEKEAELKSSENVVQHKKAPRLSKYICHSCNKVSAVTKGHDIKCGHCHSDFVEEQVGIGPNDIWFEIVNNIIIYSLLTYVYGHVGLAAGRRGLLNMLDSTGRQRALKYVKLNFKRYYLSCFVPLYI